jgi:type I restriction enzyme, S subunit
MPSKPRLGDYFSNRQEPGRDGLPVMSVTMNDSLMLRDELERRSESALRPNQHLLVRKGDIAYNMMRMWQGACGLAEADGIVSPAYVVLAPKPSIDSRFAYQWFKSTRLIHLFWAYSHGLTKDRLRLYFDEFAEIPVAPPALEEQRRIVGILETWDRAVEQTEKLIAAKRRRWLLLVGELRHRWQPVALGKLGRWVGGGTPSKSVPAYWQNGDIPWVSPKDMGGWQVSTAEDAITARAVAESATQLLPAGSVLVVTRSGILRTKVPVAVATCPVAINQDIKALLLRNIRFGSVIAALIHAEADRLRQASVKTGTTVESIDIEGLKSFQLKVPQDEIDVAAAYAVVVGGLQEIDNLERQLLNVRKAKRCLMRKLLTGVLLDDPFVRSAVSVPIFAAGGAE